MYSIIQKIYEKHNKILKEGLEKVFRGNDVSTLTGSIKEFTDVFGQELFSEIVTQIDKIAFEDSKRKCDFQTIGIRGKKLITKNGKTKFERRYYEDKETGEHVYLADKILGIDSRERIDKNVKAEIIRNANDESYNKSGKNVVPHECISATTVMRNVRKNEWYMDIEERKAEDKIKLYIFKLMKTI